MERKAATRLTTAEGRRFAFTVGPAFAALGGLAWWRGDPRVATLLLAIGLALAMAGLTVPRHLGPLQSAWMALARAISRLTTPILLGIVYYGVITPTGLLRRTIGGNPLRRSRDVTSCWVSRRGAPRSDLDRQF